MLNLNTFAKEITEDEGGEVNLSIAQVKEVLKITLNKLAELKPSEVLKLLESRVVLLLIGLLLLGSVPAAAWNPVTDIRDNVIWTFGKVADAGSGYDFAAKKWRTSALAEIAQYRFLSASYGATIFDERTPTAVDSFKIGFMSNGFFALFTNKPTAEMAWMQNLNIGPSYAIPVFSGETGHKGVFLLDVNYRFGGSSAAPLVYTPSSPAVEVPPTSKLNLSPQDATTL